MGVIGALGGYGIFILIYHLCRKSHKGFFIALAVSAWFSVVMGATATAIELAMSGTSPLVVVLPTMVGVHAIHRHRRSRHHHNLCLAHSENEAGPGRVLCPYSSPCEEKGQRARCERGHLMKKRLDGIDLDRPGDLSPDGPLSLTLCLLFSGWPREGCRDERIQRQEEKDGDSGNMRLCRIMPFRGSGTKRYRQAVSGLIGTLAIFLIVFGVGKWMSKPRTKRAQPDRLNPPDPDRRLK